MLISILTPFYTANPTAPEDARPWEGWLAGLATQAGPCEIIVAGTSPDKRGSWQATLAQAAGPDFPHRLICLHLPYRPPDPPTSRAAALNAAAAAARGSLLLLLHADNRLPVGALASIRNAAAHGAAAGAFPKRYDRRPPLLRLQEWWLNSWRLGCWRRTVGTNAVWLRRSRWQPLPDWRLLEDIVLDQRLRRAAVPLHLSRQPVEVSADKYLRTGVLRSMAINAAVLLLFRAGVAADVLADELYRRAWLPPGRAGFPASFARQIARCWRSLGQPPDG